MSPLMYPSYWRSWGLILNLQRPCGGKQEPRHHAQARLHKHRAGCEDWPFPTMERQEENRGYGSVWSPVTMAV